MWLRKQGITQGAITPKNKPSKMVQKDRNDDVTACKRKYKPQHKRQRKERIILTQESSLALRISYG